MSMKEKVTVIGDMDPTQLWKAAMQSNYVAGPAPVDGILFTENVHSAFKRGNVQTNFKLIITTVAYEGKFYSMNNLSSFERKCCYNFEQLKTIFFFVRKNN